MQNTFYVMVKRLEATFNSSPDDYLALYLFVDMDFTFLYR